MLRYFLFCFFSFDKKNKCEKRRCQATKKKVLESPAFRRKRVWETRRLTPTPAVSLPIYAVTYALFLGFLFLGIAIISDKFMSAIEVSAILGFFL